MTETTTIPVKEDNITPVDPEKKPEVKQEPEAIQPENEVSDSKPEEKVKEIKPINNGYLLKSSKLLVMKHWSRSYFEFGSEGQPISLPNLKTYHRKNVKRGIPKPSAAGNTSSKDDEPSKVVESTKVEESKKTDESAKVDESPKVEESKKADEPPKAEESTSADVVEEVKVDDKPKEDEKEESGKKQVDDKKSPETKDEKPKDEVTVTPYVKKVFENIAHASQTGEGLLFYFKSDTQKNIPHGIINLKDVKDVIALKSEHVGKQFAFKIETEYRTFELAAENEEDRESWIKTIKEKSNKAKESSVVAVDESKFNETYEKLTKGTAFTGEASRHAGELSDEPFSGDEETADKSRSTESNKRKSFLPFAFGRKTSTNEPIAPITENTEDVATENTTEETEESKTGEPKSPPKASKFLSFFNKRPESTQSTPKADDDKAKTADETTNAETSNAAAATNGAEHPEVEKKKFNVSDYFLKKTSSKETPKDDNKEVASNVEQGEQTESKPETTETPADETTQHKEGSSFFKNIFKKPIGETSETKAETTEPSADVTTTEVKNDGNKETEETTDTHDAEDKDKTEDKVEPSLVRRVTTKIFGAKRAKSPKADDKKSESISRDLVDETEEKKEETEETKPTENADATAQTSDQTADQTTEQTAEQNAEQTAGPESSTETENKKKEKSSIFNFGRRKSGGVKKENSESQEKAETDGEAVASATEATDVEEPKEEKAEKIEKSGQKAVFPDEKRTKKSGNLLKQTGFISKSFEQRYFVLTDDKKLYYYRTSNESDASTQKSIDILKVKIVDGNKFDLETKSRTYKLGAESEEDRESWIQVFKELGFEVVESNESTSESKETPKKLDDVVPSGSGNENDIEKSVKDAADKSADTADAKVTEAQEITTQTAKVEESTEEITAVTETTEINTSS